ncbi:MAG: hypothetical protein HZB13_04260 [Acidobacteria bacterium]|nr:hypothetical protein [Acidobacteriota bacterium]
MDDTIRNGELVMRRFVLFLLTSTMWAAIQAPRPLNMIVAEAELIVIGEVDKWSLSAGTLSGQLTVTGVIKGTAPMGSLVMLDGAVSGLPSSPGLIQPTVKSRNWLCALDRTHKVIPRVSGALLGPEDLCFPLADAVLKVRPGEDEVARVAGILLDSYAIAGFGNVLDLDQVLEPLTWKKLAAIPKPSSGAFADVVGAALAVRGSERNAPLLVQQALRPDLPTVVRDGLGNQLCHYYRNPDSAGMAVLGELTADNTGSRRARRCAVNALRNIHTAAALPYLVKLLEDADELAAFDAIMGLASFANDGANALNLPLVDGATRIERDRTAHYRTPETLAAIPDWQMFKRERPRLVQFWKNWWTENKGAIAR